MADTVEQGTEVVAGEAAPVEASKPVAAKPPAAAKPTVAKARKAKAPVAVKTVTAPAPAEVVTPAPAIAEPVIDAPVIPAPTEKKIVAKKPVVAKTKAPKTTKPVKPAAAAPVTRTATASSKEARIMTTPATEYTEKFQTAIKEASEKAKAAFEKSQASFGEIGEFTKGNVEALVESTKIFATGFQALSKGYLTESKSAFETLTAEIKELTAAKTPTELLEKQSTLLRKQFDAAVAASSKNSEAVLKLANEAFQPISTRVTLAVEKVKKAA